MAFGPSEAPAEHCGRGKCISEPAIASPLLVNILLGDLDRELDHRGHRFVRYADDLLVLVKSVRAGQRVMASLTAYLGTKLKRPYVARLRGAL